MWPGTRSQCDRQRERMNRYGQGFTYCYPAHWFSHQWEKAGLTVLSGAIFCLHAPHRGILSTAWRYHWAKALAGIMNRPLRWQRLPYKGYLISQQQHSARIDALLRFYSAWKKQINITKIAHSPMTSIFLRIKTKFLWVTFRFRWGFSSVHLSS